MATLPIPASTINPVLAEIDQAHAALSPEAQKAIAIARQATDAAPAPGTPEPSAASPAVAPIRPVEPRPTILRGTPSGDADEAAGTVPYRPMALPGKPVPTLGALTPDQLAAHQQHRDTLNTLQNSPNGIGGIKNPWARIPLQIAEATLGSFFPGVDTLLPGTQLHHNALVRQARGAVNEDTGQEDAQTKRHLQEAQAQEQESLPDLHQAKSDLEGAKLNEKTTHDQASIDVANAKEKGLETGKKATVAAALHQHGFKEDEKGNIVPLEYGEMSEQQQAVHDLKGSQEELNDATASLRKAQAANAPVLMQMAQQRIETAKQNATRAVARLGLSQQQFEMRAHGTQAGVPLPGAILDDENKPVGTAFQQNVRPTGQQRNKADLATSAHEQIGDLKDIVARRKDIFGPLAGRTTDFQVWLGSQDPDAQRFRAARTIAGDHLAGVFGGRSEAALSAIDNAIGHFKDNPAAITAGLDQLDKANKVFLVRGTPKTVGSNAERQANAPEVVEYVRDKSGKLVRKNAENH